MPSLLAVLTDPDAFFSALDAGDELGYLVPGLIVAATGVVGAINASLWSSLATNALPSGARQFGAIAGVLGAVGGFVASFLVWVVVAVVFFALGVFFDPGGSLGETFAFVGWGFVPRFIGACVSVVFTYVGLDGVTPPSDPTQYAQFASSLQHEPPFVVGSLVGVAFLLWEGFVWTFATKHARGLSTRDAAIVVFVPVGLFALYRVVSVVLL